MLFRSLSICLSYTIFITLHPVDKLGKLPVSIGKCTELVTLCAGDNFIGEIPATIGGCSKLTKLDLHQNALRGSPIPDAIGDLTALRVLLLDHNSIETLPAMMGQLVALRVLRVDHNNLTEIPAALCGLRGMTELNASQNLIERLPEHIGALCSGAVLGMGIRRIYLHCNKLRHLPESFAALTSLESLTLFQNQLQSLVPAGWSKGDGKDGARVFGKEWKRLKSLKLHNNR